MDIACREWDNQYPTATVVETLDEIDADILRDRPLYEFVDPELLGKIATDQTEIRCTIDEYQIRIANGVLVVSTETETATEQASD